MGAKVVKDRLPTSWTDMTGQPLGARLCRGFTLLEMLVVLVLLGLVSSMTLPAMQRWHDAVESRAQLAQVIEALRGAMFSAAARRQDILLDMDSFKPTNEPGEQPAIDKAATPGIERARIALPAGWVAERAVVATFMANGLCKPGMVLLSKPLGQHLTVTVAGPACRIDTADSVATAAR